MLTQIISQYLIANKRLVVPQLGSFLVKTPGEEVVFSELLKRDDGVLRGLLCARGMSELEAAGEINRFAFEIRHAIEHGEQVILDGFGCMKAGPNETIVFEYRYGASTIFTPKQESDYPHDELLQNNAYTEEYAADPSSAFHAKEEPDASMPKISPSAKLNPAPYVKGLRYGKPRKNTDSYSYINGKSRRMDRFMFIAIAAAIVAVAAIVFGYFQMSRAKAIEAEQIQMTSEQNASDSVANPTQTTQK